MRDDLMPPVPPMRRFKKICLRFSAGATVLLGVLVLGLGLSKPAVAGGTVEVRFKVPVRARLDLTNVETVTLAPFLVVSQEGEMPIARRGVNVQEEFEEYLKRILRRRTRLKLVEAGPIDYPTYDFADLSKNHDFWRVVGERTGADLILAGSLDFDIQDRSGYRTEAYESPYDGRTYYRQVLVEQTGFEYDIVMEVYDGKTGKRVYSDNFKDFKQFAGESVDPLTGMFENLQSLEDRISGVFSQKRVETTRLLFTN
ncbi:MAG: hypothetical protein IH936_00010 [Acidobacteria bacterium]|nr:hypothetical protein [Acidobacteriota bacterium]